MFPVKEFMKADHACCLADFAEKKNDESKEEAKKEKIKEFFFNESHDVITPLSVSGKKTHLYPADFQLLKLVEVPPPDFI